VLDDDGGDVLCIILNFHHLFDFYNLLIDILHGALGLPLNPIHKTMVPYHLNPSIQFPPGVITDEEIRYLIRDGVPDVVRHEQNCEVDTSILRQSIFEVEHLR